MDLSVNYGTLAAAAADIQASAAQIESRLADLDRSLQPLRANWSGEAATAYEAAKAKWTTALTDMKMLLTQIGNAPYSVTKHAAVGFAEWLNITHGDDGVRVTVRAPWAAPRCSS